MFDGRCYTLSRHARFIFWHPPLPASPTSLSSRLVQRLLHLTYTSKRIVMSCG